MNAAGNGSSERRLVTSFAELGTGMLVEAGPCVRCTKMHVGILGNRRDDLYRSGGFGPAMSVYWLDPNPGCVPNKGKLIVTEDDVVARTVYVIADGLESPALYEAELLRDQAKADALNAAPAVHERRERAGDRR